VRKLGERAGFEREYLSLRREYARLRRSARYHAQLAEPLLRDGLVVIPGFFDTDRTEEMRAAAPDIGDCQLSPEGTLTRFFSDAHAIAELNPFFGSPVIAATMRQVLGAKAVMHRSTVQYRTATGHTGAFEHFFHIDTWRPRYKAFLYLNDVDEENGPFTYTPRTHFGAWRRRYDRDIGRVFQPGADGYIHDDQSAYVGCLWPHEYAILCERLRTGPTTVTGKAGTLILFDARGLHKIQPLLRAPRIILSSYWIREGQHT